MNTEVQATGEIALSLARLAKRAVGPAGTVVKVPEEDAPLLRSAFISRVAEASMKILEEGV